MSTYDRIPEVENGSIQGTPLDSYFFSNKAILISRYIVFAGIFSVFVLLALTSEQRLGIINGTWSNDRLYEYSVESQHLYENRNYSKLKNMYSTDAFMEFPLGVKALSFKSNTKIVNFLEDVRQLSTFSVFKTPYTDAVNPTGKLLI